MHAHAVRSGVGSNYPRDSIIRDRRFCTAFAPHTAPHCAHGARSPLTASQVPFVYFHVLKLMMMIVNTVIAYE